MKKIETMPRQMIATMISIEPLKISCEKSTQQIYKCRMCGDPMLLLVV